MDHVLARVKRLTKKPYRKVISDHTLFEGLDVSLQACVPYNPDHNLDEDSWFKIEDFSQKDFCLPILTAEFDSKDYDDLVKKQFKKIAFIVAVQGDDFYFQKITRSLFISKKFVSFGEAAEIEQPDNRLVINSIPDAIYFKEVDTLVFKNLASISSIFKGIDELYREATQEEVESFLDESFIELTGDFDAENVSKPNRKRIAMAMNTLSEMSEEAREQIPDYIGDYCGEVLEYDEDNECFKIGNDEQLKNLVYGIEQRFYTTPFGQEKRLANSVQAIN